MSHTISRLAVVGAVLAAAWCAADAAEQSQVVRKVAETFDDTPWIADRWNRANGTVELSGDVAGDSGGGRCLAIEVRFSGRGFEHFSAVPAQPLLVPGDLRQVTLRYKIADKRYPLIVKFRDGWGRTEVGKTRLEWPLPGAENEWRSATFQVPADWVRPLAIAGVTTHNWSAQAEARTVRFWLDHLEVETDLGAVDMQTGALTTWRPDPSPADPSKALRQPPQTPLVAVEFETGQPGNVFSRQAPAVTVRLRNWKAGALEAAVTCVVRDKDGREVDRQRRQASVDAPAGIALPLRADRFGLYTLEAEAAVSDGTRSSRRMTFARVPPEAQLTAAEKLASPYGLNVHGARDFATVEPFRRAGVVWFRDYAFNFEWMLRAKGDDRRYEGWPGYPALVRRYTEAGVCLLACLMKGIRPPRAGQPLGPDAQWVRQMADIILTFPQVTHWELDNEYDLAREHAEAEEAVGWRNYGAYHRKFAEVVGVLGGAVAVEQGQAGIWPARVAGCVESGDFAQIAVVNSHHYCGSEPPELNLGNWNTDSEADFRWQPPRTFFDSLRQVKRAAQADGRRRESWLTEFGWDNLAGPRVSAFEQAAYLARGWMVAMAAGTDKCFWFYDFDSPEPKQFFDGCGLLAADGSPKLALCALAGLASVLPSPRYVGSLDAGPDTCGYVFESGGRLVAALWTIKTEQGPAVTFGADHLCDYLGNRLDGLSVRLSRAPVYAVGLDRGSPWYAQTAYELDTPQAVVAAAGDTVTAAVAVTNNRAAPLSAQVRLLLPEGWPGPAEPVAVAAAPGEKKTAALRFTVPPTEAFGMKDARLVVTEQQVVKQIPFRVIVRPALAMQVEPLRGEPGQTTFTVKVTNRTDRPMDGVLRLRLPATWQAVVAETAVKDLMPGQTRTVKCDVKWSADWKADESAVAEFDAGGGRTIRRSVVPARLVLRRAGEIRIDGRLDDWPPAARVPDWMLGSTLGDPAAGIYLAWAPEGLYGAVQAAGATLEGIDPRSFWLGDCLEIFIDTRGDRRQRSFQPGDHQFWLVPLVGEGRVYVGRWKRKDEIPATVYDIPGIRSACVRQGDGYAFEFLIPASVIQDWQPRQGARMGLNLNLTVKGPQFTREVFWPAAKSNTILNDPGAWGTVELAP